MTEQPFRKNIIAFAVFSILAVIAVWYGFSLITSPFELQMIKYDQTRVTDMDKLKTEISNFYQKNYKLPSSLNEIPDKPTTDEYGNIYSGSYTSTTGKISKKDPQTTEPYEYVVVDSANYKLCAVFGTDNKIEEVNDNSNYYSSVNYKYSSIKASYKHTQGRNCFDQSVYSYGRGGGGSGGGGGSYYNYSYPLPTPPPFREISPYQQTNCFGNNCNIEVEVSPVPTNAPTTGINPPPNKLPPPPPAF